MPSPLSLQAKGTLGTITPGAALALAAIIPLLAQIDGLLGAEFGLGGLKGDLVAQYTAALNASVSLSNPLLQMTLALKAAADLVASIQSALDAGLVPPAFQVNVTTQLELLAALQVKLGAINALIELALGIKGDGLALAAQLQAALSVGPAAIYAATGQTLGDVVNQISGYDYSDAELTPGDTVTAILILSKAPGFHAGASFLFPLPPP